MRSRKLALKAFDLEIAVRDHGTTRTVTPSGEIDLASIQSVRAPLRAAVSDRFEHVVLDLGETTFMDSTGLHLVLDLRAQAEAQGARFVVLPGPPAVQRLFTICGVDDLTARSGSE